MNSKPKILIADFDRTLAYLYKDERTLRVLAKKIVAHYSAFFVVSDKSEKEEQDGYFVWFKLHNQALKLLGDEAHLINEKAEQLVTAFEIEILSKIDLISGISKSMQKLHDNGITLAIVSNNATDALKYALRRAHIDHLFLYIGGRAIPFMPERLKPSPYALLTALHYFNVAASSDIWYVGDDISDIEAALAANIKPVGVYSGRHNEKELQNAGATLTFSNFNALSEYIINNL